MGLGSADHNHVWLVWVVCPHVEVVRNLIAALATNHYAVVFLGHSHHKILDEDSIASFFPSAVLGQYTEKE